MKLKELIIPVPRHNVANSLKALAAMDKPGKFLSKACQLLVCRNAIRSAGNSLITNHNKTTDLRKSEAITAFEYQVAFMPLA